MLVKLGKLCSRTQTMCYTTVPPGATGSYAKRVPNLADYIGDRSPITSKLWELRMRMRESLNPNRLENQPQTEIHTKTPRDSYVEIIVSRSSPSTG